MNVCSEGAKAKNNTGDQTPPFLSGAGNFGSVMKGVCKVNKQDIPVAVKTLKAVDLQPGIQVRHSHDFSAPLLFFLSLLKRYEEGTGLSLVSNWTHHLRSAQTFTWDKTLTASFLPKVAFVLFFNFFNELIS